MSIKLVQLRIQIFSNRFSDKDITETFQSTQSSSGGHASGISLVYTSKQGPSNIFPVSSDSRSSPDVLSLQSSFQKQIGNNVQKAMF